MTPVANAIARRNQNFDRTAEELLSLVAKQALGLRVAQDDLPPLSTITLASGAASSNARK